MAYRVFYTDVGSTDVEPELSRLMPVTSNTLEEALGVARKLREGHAVVWRIYGPDGFSMARSAIEQFLSLSF